MPEIGKIKIGKKGELRTGKNGPYRLPVKQDHFTITTLEKDSEDNYIPDIGLMQSIGNATNQDPVKLTRIPVRLLWNDVDLNFASRYAAYGGTSVWCTGDGEKALRTTGQNVFAERECPCPNLDRDFHATRENPKCKIAGLLSVIIEGAGGVGGVHKFRTTSFNSTDGITAALMFLSGVTGGQIAGVALDMTLNPKRVADPSGKAQTVYVVGLEFRGTVEALRDEGYRIALGNTHAKLRLEQIENQARRLLPEPGEVFPGEDAQDIIGEFNPPQEAADGMDANTEEAAGSGTGPTDGPPPPIRRKRRTKAEMEAAKAAEEDGQAPPAGDAAQEEEQEIPPATLDGKSALNPEPVEAAAQPTTAPRLPEKPKPIF